MIFLKVAFTFLWNTISSPSILTHQFLRIRELRWFLSGTDNDWRISNPLLLLLVKWGGLVSLAFISCDRLVNNLLHCLGKWKYKVAIHIRGFEFRSNFTFKFSQFFLDFWVDIPWLLQWTTCKRHCIQVKWWWVASLEHAVLYLFEIRFTSENDFLFWRLEFWTCLRWEL